MNNITRLHYIYMIMIIILSSFDIKAYMSRIVMIVVISDKRVSAFLRRALKFGTCVSGYLPQPTTSLHTCPITWDLKGYLYFFINTIAQGIPVHQQLAWQCVNSSLDRRVVCPSGYHGDHVTSL